MAKPVAKWKKWTSVLTLFKYKEQGVNGQYNFNGADDTNVQNNFLGEMWEQLNSLKTMVEGQKQSGHAMVFPSQQPQGQQPSH